ncbi:MAG: hypothetical protein GX629_05790, partial [Phycisphaerae bacterium]|nr:hypothetical protein [Phycisphaerae bacterium]
MRQKVVLCGFLLGLTMALPVTAQVVFESDFTGPQGEPIASLSQWSTVLAPSVTTQTIDNNMGKLHNTGNGWYYMMIRADKAEEVACNFQPISTTGNRFEHTVYRAESTDNDYALMHRVWLAPRSDVDEKAFACAGERAILNVQWSKTSNNTTIELRIAHTPNGVIAYSFPTVSVDLDGGDQLRLALELRDGDGSDIRIAYKIYKVATDTWGEWITSPWFDPTDSAYGANAFAADWKDRWNNSTYYYIETNSRSGNLESTAWIDDVQVTGEPLQAEPPVVFESDFSGTQGDPVASLNQWSNAAAQSGTTRTIDNNMARFYGNGTGWYYQSIRADKAEGVAFNFQPISAVGNRFEHTIMNVDTTDTDRGLMHRVWLSPFSNITVPGYEAPGERVMLDVRWNKTTNAISFWLKVINTATSGVIACELTDSVDLDGGDHLRLALELRDGGGKDVRIAYKVYNGLTGIWSDWTTSAWFDPTDSTYGVDAFGSDWKNRWTNNTYYYIEHNCRISGSTP